MCVVDENLWLFPYLATYRVHWQVEADGEQPLGVHTIACEGLVAAAPYDAVAGVVDAVDKGQDVAADDADAVLLACPKDSHFEKTPRVVVAERV